MRRGSETKRAQGRKERGGGASVWCSPLQRRRYQVRLLHPPPPLLPLPPDSRPERRRLRRRYIYCWPEGVPQPSKKGQRYNSQ